eukprot:scaffold12.g8221.t1
MGQAVNLFFASGEVGSGGGGPAGGGLAASGGFDGSSGSLPGLEDDEALARRLAAEGAGASAEDEVRAPIPTRMDRLYGDEYGGYAGPPAQRRPPANPVPHTVVDAFRDFNFEEAKQHAAEAGQWLLVNLQSTSAFGSHQLNRDTWRNDMVASLVQENFTFFQAYDMVEEGQKVQHYYKAYDLPAILVVDPVTGAPMRHWTGFLDAERVVEELMPFLETSIHDPGAARLAAGLKRRRGDGSRQARARAAAACLRGGTALQPLSEEEELRRAIEASLEQPGGSGGPAEGECSAVLCGGRCAGQQQQQQQQPEQQQAPAPPAPPAAEVAAEAAARLPAEPAAPDGCRVAVRLPDGRRPQRRFPRAAPVSALYDYCLTLSEEAAGGRPFTLAHTVPGAPDLASGEQALEEAGVADSMLALRWAS